MRSTTRPLGGSYAGSLGFTLSGGLLQRFGYRFADDVAVGEAFELRHDDLH